MIKIKVSCSTREELAGVIRLLSPYTRKIKTPKEKPGEYVKAYFEDVELSEIPHDRKL